MVLSKKKSLWYSRPPLPYMANANKKIHFFREHFPQHNEILLHITTKIQPCKKEYRSQLKQQEHRLDVDNVTTRLIVRGNGYWVTGSS